MNLTKVYIVTIPVRTPDGKGFVLLNQAKDLFRGGKGAIMTIDALSNTTNVFYWGSNP